MLAPFRALHTDINLTKFGKDTRYVVIASSLPVAETPNALDTHQQLIQDLIEKRQRDAQIVAILFRRGVQTSKKSLRRRLQF